MRPLAKLTKEWNEFHRVLVGLLEQRHQVGENIERCKSKIDQLEEQIAAENVKATKKR